MKGKSPTVKYSMGTAFSRNGNPGTELNLYNTWQSRKDTEGQWDRAEVSVIVQTPNSDLGND